MQNVTYTAATAKGPLPRAWWFNPQTGLAEPIPYGEAGFDPMAQNMDLDQFWKDLSSTERFQDHPQSLQP